MAVSTVPAATLKKKPVPPHSGNQEYTVPILRRSLLLSGTRSGKAEVPPSSFQYHTCGNPHTLPAYWSGQLCLSFV